MTAPQPDRVPAPPGPHPSAEQSRPAHAHLGKAAGPAAPGPGQAQRSAFCPTAARGWTRPRGAACSLNFPFRSDKQDQLCLRHLRPGLRAGNPAVVPATDGGAQTWVSAATPLLEWPPPPGGPGTRFRQSAGQSSVSVGMENSPWTPKDPECWAWTPGRPPGQGGPPPTQAGSGVWLARPSPALQPAPELRLSRVPPKQLRAGSRDLDLPP